MNGRTEGSAKKNPNLNLKRLSTSLPTTNLKSWNQKIRWLAADHSAVHFISRLLRGFLEFMCVHDVCTAVGTQERVRQVVLTVSNYQKTAATQRFY